MFPSLKTMKFSSTSFYVNPHTPASVAVKPTITRPMSLSAPMINRVHTTKPGCSACGKRVV
jgi:hypothetical protein